jgi:hypothetical protein
MKSRKIEVLDLLDHFRQPTTRSEPVRTPPPPRTKKPARISPQMLAPTIASMTLLTAPGVVQAMRP